MSKLTEKQGFRMTTNKRFNPVHKQMTNVLGYECVFDDLEKKWLSIRDVIILVNKLNKENNELKKELSEYKDFVLSDDKILCYTCLFCTHKGIYEVDCDVKGHVDVHGTCHSYTKKELQE